MTFLTNYYKNIVKYDLLNKFIYKTPYNIPKIQKIILNFNYKKQNLKILITSLLALELISSQKSMILKSKISNITVKLRKGNPIGCKLTLRNYRIPTFLAKLIQNIYIKSKIITLFQNNKFLNTTISFQLKNILIFPELEAHYQFFKNISCLNITIVSTPTTTKEFFFLLKNYKIPISLICAKVTQLVEYNLAKVKVEGSNPFFCY